MTAGPELGGKRLELLKQAVPETTRVAALWNVSAAPQHAREWHATEEAATALGISLLRVEGRTPQDFERAFSQITSWRAQALLLPGEHRKQIIEFAARQHLPAMYGSREGAGARGPGVSAPRPALDSNLAGNPGQRYAEPSRRRPGLA